MSDTRQQLRLFDVRKHRQDSHNKAANNDNGSSSNGGDDDGNNSSRSTCNNNNNNNNNNNANNTNNSGINADSDDGLLLHITSARHWDAVTALLLVRDTARGEDDTEQRNKQAKLPPSTSFPLSPHSCVPMSMVRRVRAFIARMLLSVNSNGPVHSLRTASSVPPSPSLASFLFAFSFLLCISVAHCERTVGCTKGREDTRRAVDGQSRWLYWSVEMRQIVLVLCSVDGI